MSMSAAHIPPAPAPGAERSGVWHRVILYGPVAVCTGGALVLAMRALPLAGTARMVFAVAVAVNVGLLALASWSSVLGFAASKRQPGHGPGVWK